MTPSQKTPSNTVAQYRKSTPTWLVLSTLILNRQDLTGDGISILWSLRAAYRRKLTSPEVENLEKKFMLRNRSPDETVDEFYSAMLDMHNEIADNNGATSMATLCRRFILNLGPDFSEIHKMYATDRLPDKWKSLNINDLLPIARSELAAVKIIRSNNANYKAEHKPGKPPPQDNNNKSSKYKKKGEKGGPTDQHDDDEKDKSRRDAVLKAIYDGSYKASNFQHMVGKGC